MRRQLRSANADHAIVCRDYFREKPEPSGIPALGFVRQELEPFRALAGIILDKMVRRSGSRNPARRIYLAIPRGEVAERPKAAVC
jgi:hypothetical protein